jgi:hypothetical protein
VIDTFLLDILMVDEEGQHLPKPMITVIIDSASKAIIDLTISTRTPKVRAAIQSIETPAALGKSTLVRRLSTILLTRFLTC